MVRTRLLLAAAGAGLLGVLPWLLGTPAPQSPDTRQAALACPALAARSADADRIELAAARQVLWLERRGNVWGLARQGGYPVQDSMAAILLQTLQGLRLAKHAPDPAPDGTSIRVLATTGATLCSLVATRSAVRRSGDVAAWFAAPDLARSTDPWDWARHTLPPLDPAQIQAVTDDGGLDAGVLPALLAAIPVTDIRPRPQVRTVPARTIRLALASGTADLAIGQADGQAWLTVSGSAPWASRLAPYAFALQPGSPLAA